MKEIAKKEIEELNSSLFEYENIEHKLNGLGMLLNNYA